MSVNKVCSPYQKGVCDTTPKSKDRLLVDLEAHPQGRVLLAFMEQEGDVRVERSATDRLEVTVTDVDGEFEPNWHETGKMSHGRLFKISLPEGMSGREAISRLKEEMRRDEKLRWLMATYISGITYIDTISETEKGVYANGCHAEAAAVKHWIDFSKWLWENTLKGRTEGDWRLKELVLQDIGVAADRSLVRYDSDENVYSYLIKNPKIVQQGLAAFKDKNATSVGPLKFERLKGKEYERVGLSQYQLHPRSADYPYRNMSPTCYQGNLYDLYTEDTNMFHHAIGYIPFYFQMRRFAGGPAEYLVRRQISIYEDGQGTDMHNGLVLGPAGGLKVKNQGDRLISGFVTHVDVGYWYPNGDIGNSLMMVEGARAIYNGDMEIDELPDFLASRCTCDQSAGEMVMGKRPPFKVIDGKEVNGATALLPEDADGPGGTLPSCSQHLPNTLGSDHLTQGSQFTLNRNPRVRALVEKWKKSPDNQERLRIAEEALKFAPQDMHLYLMYIGTAMEIFNAKKAKGERVDENRTAGLVEKIRVLNMSMNLAEMRKVWEACFDYDLPEVLVKYKQWSTRDCMRNGYCDNPVWKYFGKKYERYCRSLEYNKVNDSGNGIDLPDDMSRYRNIRPADSLGEIYFEYQSDDDKWHRCKYFGYLEAANYMVVDGLDVVTTQQQDMFITNRIVFPHNREKRLVGNVYEAGSQASLSHAMIIGSDDLRLAAFENWHQCLNEEKMFTAKNFQSISFFKTRHNIDVRSNLEFGIYAMDKFIEERLSTKPEAALRAAALLTDTLIKTKQDHSQSVRDLDGKITRLRSQLEILKSLPDESYGPMIDEMMMQLDVI